MDEKKVLVIDDNEDILELVGARLASAGYLVYKLLSGKNILEKVKEIYPDLILLDIMMPDIDGMEVKEALNSDPQGAMIPVIFLTAKDTVGDKIKGLSLGAEDYITKPFDSAELLARVEAAIKRKMFYEKISMTDGLTGLHNVNYFKNQIKTFFNIAKRYEKVFTLAVIDIDEFKEINDTYGHAGGDFVLRKFAEIASETIRESDIMTRYGGDEFTVIMPQTDAKQAEAMLKRLREKIEGQVFWCEEAKKEIRFSFSAGVAPYSVIYSREQEMFIEADKKMYEDKERRGSENAKK